MQSQMPTTRGWENKSNIRALTYMFCEDCMGEATDLDALTLCSECIEESRKVAVAKDRSRWIALLDGAGCTCKGPSGSHYRPCPHYFRDLMRMNTIPGEVVHKR